MERARRRAAGSQELDDRRQINAADEAPVADDLLTREQALHAALSRFVALPPLQRSCVILEDVLDLSLEAVAELLDTTVSAVQAALHRGRRALRESPPAAVPPAISPTLARYAALFGARDWDGVRAMLADDVRLHVVDRSKRRGRAEVEGYFGNYGRLADWTIEPKVLDGGEVLAVSRHGSPAHVIALTIEGDRITGIRDYFHVPYILNDARFG